MCIYVKINVILSTNSVIFSGQKNSAIFLKKCCQINLIKKLDRMTKLMTT